MIVGVVTSHFLDLQLLVCVSEVDVTHIVLVVNEIGVESIVVPEVVRVVLALPMALDHLILELAHSVEDVGPHGGANRVEGGVDWAEHLVGWVRGDGRVRLQVGEGLLPRGQRVLHKGEGAKPEHGDSGASVRSPVSVQVHFERLVEDSVAAAKRLTRHTLSKIARLSGQHVGFIERRTSVRLVEPQIGFV